ncbi:MAG: hypothetical protein QM796_04240 [Chthoniobacteraceae bacterium]
MIFLLAVVAATCLYFQGRGKEQSAYAYVWQAEPAIILHWNEGAFLAQASPKLLSEYPRSKINEWFGFFSRLGPLKTSDRPQFRYCNFYQSFLGGTWQIVYVTNAEFQRGNAQVFMIVSEQEDSTWKISGFFVNVKRSLAQLNGSMQHSIEEDFQSFGSNPLDAPAH